MKECFYCLFIPAQPPDKTIAEMVKQEKVALPPPVFSMLLPAISLFIICLLWIVFGR